MDVGYVTRDEFQNVLNILLDLNKKIEEIE